MSKALVLLLVGSLAISALVPGCSPKSEAEPGRYYDRDCQFSIWFPEEWMIREGDGENWPKVEAVSPWEDDYDEFSEYVAVDVEGLLEAADLADYFEETVKMQAVETPSYEEQGRGEAKIGDIDARWVEFGFESEGGMVVVLGYNLVKGTTGYLISCVAEEGKFSSYRSQFEEIVTSFRFE
jgi:hypothetical protein